MPLEKKTKIFCTMGPACWDVPTLLEEFRKHAKSTGPSESEMNHIQAADFLQKHGKTRTGLQRKDELADIDLNNDGQIAFIEYCLLHYKVMVLGEYYKRHETAPAEDLTNDGVGVVGVGAKILEELFTFPQGMSPELEAAIEDFGVQKRARDKKIKELSAKAAAGGVKGMAAKNELIILEHGDMTEINRIELTLQAAKRRAEKQAGSDVYEQQKKKAEAEAKAEREAQRAKMAERRKAFEK